MSKIQEHNEKYCMSTLKLKSDLEMGFLVLGEHLYKIRTESLWESSWDSWRAFTDELKLSKNTINKVIKIYEVFVLKFAFPNDYIANAGGWSLVADLLPVTENGDRKNALHWLHLATQLTRSDIRRELTEARTGIPQLTCQHKHTHQITVCNDCGVHMKV